MPAAELVPTTLPELVEAVRSTPRLLAVGGGTKPRLSAVDAVKLSTQRLQGITEYEPSEFTFTALAGTLLRDIAATLSDRGQYLPFDPMCIETGGTLGGAVAAGLSGPGRFRFGGMRDFILGGRFVDGGGRLLRMGGKVVKNAAGFDLPKFFVGSLGRFGVLAELTFKVFPAPASTLTLSLVVKDMETAARILIEAANTRWELQALDVLPGVGKLEGKTICLRLGGPAPALEAIAGEVLARWPGKKLTPAEAQTVWSELREFSWAHRNGPLLKVALTPTSLPQLEQALNGILDARIHVSAGGNVAFVSLASAAAAATADQRLRELALPAVTLRGDAPLWCGARQRAEIAGAVKEALDAEHRFPGLDQ
jgi:glycolate oxidase FAD binding subunit